ncbi:MAG TPA: tetratricopeptide repeat protein [Anaerolineales bacterium]|nr:tetratricopeptide repeat protein [Anaerolineales bacterium]
MSYLDVWRAQLGSNLNEFARLAGEDRSIHLIYGIIASAALWSVRDASSNTEQREALKIACGNEKHLSQLLTALGDWDQMTSLAAAQNLSKRQSQNADLQAALNAVLSYFAQDLLAEKVIRQQNITISGNISGGNIVIGGYQVVAGDLIIKQIRQNVKSCPTAPNPPPHFTGREKELREIQQALGSTDRVAITAVKAMGGMGKTALAQAVCHLPEHSFDAVLWAVIGEKPDLKSILQEWARYAVDDFKPEPEEDENKLIGWVRAQLTQLASAKQEGGSRWLVVFDDVWNTPDSYQVVAQLQEALPPSTKILITTRQADTVSFLHAHPIELFELSDADALSLLQKLRSSNSKDLTDEHLKRLVSLIRGHPLTLEIAIASLNNAEDAFDIETILDDYERGIREGSPFDALNLSAETPQILNVVFGRSYEALSETDQLHFRALGVFALGSSWDRAFSGVIWNIQEERQRTIAIKSLRLRALVQQDQESMSKYAGTWYIQHPLLHSYARALLRQTPEEYEAVSLAYVEATLVQLTYLHETPTTEAWETTPLYTPHISECGHLVEQWCSQARGLAEWKKLSVRFSMGVMHYLNRNGNIHVELGHMPFVVSRGNEIGLYALLETLGVPHARELNEHRSEAALLEFLSYFYFALAYHDDVLGKFERIIELLQLDNDPEAAAIACSKMAHYYIDLFKGQKKSFGDRAQVVFSDKGAYAVWLLEKTAELYHTTDNKIEEARALTWIGYIYFEKDDFDKAREVYQTAYQLLQEAHEKQGESDALFSIANACFSQDKLTEALPLYEKVLELKRELQDRNGQEDVLGMIVRVKGAVMEALPYYEQILAINKELQDEEKTAMTLQSMARINSLNGNKTAALDLYLQQHDLYAQMGVENDNFIKTKYNVAGVLMALNEFERANVYYMEALNIAIRLKSRAEEASVRFALGMLHYRQKHLGLAIEYMSEAVKVEEETQHPDLEEDRAMLHRVIEEANQVTQVELPKETLESILSTVWLAVTKMTSGDRRDVRDGIQQFRQQAVQLHDHDGLAFFDALTRILDGQPPEIPVDNLYYSHVQTLIQLINTNVSDENSVSAESEQLFLPFDKVKGFIQNTFSAKTSMPERLAEWKETVQAWRDDCLEINDDLTWEIEFFDTLLAILDDKPVALSGGNPYSQYLAQLLAGLEEDRKTYDTGSQD